MHLNEEQRHELFWRRDRDPKPYLRERCAALPILVEGTSALQIARYCLYRAREPDTVIGWFRHYQQEGLAGRHFPFIAHTLRTRCNTCSATCSQ